MGRCAWGLSLAETPAVVAPCPATQAGFPLTIDAVRDAGLIVFAAAEQPLALGAPREQANRALEQVFSAAPAFWGTSG